MLMYHDWKTGGFIKRLVGTKQVEVTVTEPGVLTIQKKKDHDITCLVLRI